MTRFQLALFAVLLLQVSIGLFSSLAFADGTPAATPAPDSTLWVIIKAVLPVLASQLGPLLTKGLSMLMEGIPGWLRPVVSIVVGSIASALTGVETGMPVEAAAGVGVAGGAAGHALMQAKPIQPAPAG